MILQKRRCCLRSRNSIFWEQRFDCRWSFYRNPYWDFSNCAVSDCFIKILQLSIDGQESFQSCTVEFLSPRNVFTTIIANNSATIEKDFSFVAQLRWFREASNFASTLRFILYFWILKIRYLLKLMPNRKEFVVIGNSQFSISQSTVLRTL